MGFIFPGTPLVDSKVLFHGYGGVFLVGNENECIGFFISGFKKSAYI